MNNDLISRSDLKKRLQARCDYGYEDFDKGYNIGIKAAIDLIDTAPTVDAIVNTIEERPTGHWILMKENSSVKMYRSGELISNYKCSMCGRCISTTPSRLIDYPFCHCGADMRGGRECITQSQVSQDQFTEILSR